MNINVKLSTKSIKSAIKALKNYKKNLEKKALLLTDKLTKQGVRLAQLNASAMSIYDSGELVNGIVKQTVGNVGIVASTATHSVYCEFGTGVVGKNSPHPLVAILGWRYDVNNHGELGWWYPKKNGGYGFTKGVASRPFMYETAQLLRQYIAPISKDVFKSD